jgi:hypothetical protein
MDEANSLSNSDSLPLSYSPSTVMAPIVKKIVLPKSRVPNESALAPTDIEGQLGYREHPFLVWKELR